MIMTDTVNRNFTKIPNNLIFTASLAPELVVLLCQLASLPPDYEFRPVNFAYKIGLSYQAFMKRLARLRKLGYCRRTPVRDSQGRIGYMYTFSMTEAERKKDGDKTETAEPSGKEEKRQSDTAEHEAYKTADETGDMSDGKESAATPDDKSDKTKSPEMSAEKKETAGEAKFFCTPTGYAQSRNGSNRCGGDRNCSDLNGSNLNGSNLNGFELSINNTVLSNTLIRNTEENKTIMCNTAAPEASASVEDSTPSVEGTAKNGENAAATAAAATAAAVISASTNSLSDRGITDTENKAAVSEGSNAVNSNAVNSSNAANSRNPDNSSNAAGNSNSNSEYLSILVDDNCNDTSPEDEDESLSAEEFVNKYPGLFMTFDKNTGRQLTGFYGQSCSKTGSGGGSGTASVTSSGSADPSGSRYGKPQSGSGYYKRNGYGNKPYKQPKPYDEERKPLCDKPEIPDVSNYVWEMLSKMDLTEDSDGNGSDIS